ncbi:MAG TPA: SAM-dependent methyltransferase, partial [Myxococcaceae bacterium]|nr:SAM-dependent methyltransferase [Myxococcaceae bacterium]
DHLLPERRKLEGELDDLRTAKAQGDKSTKGRAEKRFAEVQKLLKELVDFIDKVSECAEKGPPPPDSKTPPREQDARFVMDLDDGVMVNGAALWPLLEPQWKDPKKWWKELATAKGRKDYDWSHLAARYFPERVEDKCHEDPSLAVAHRCFWRLHPAKAYAWELRLRDEIHKDFTIDEPDSRERRVKFLTEREHEARKLEEAERVRRERKARKESENDAGPLFEEAANE